MLLCIQTSPVTIRTKEGKMAEQLKFEPATDEKPWAAEDLLHRPFLDLLERPVECFAPMLRAEMLPSNEVLKALYEVLLHRVVYTLLRKNDTAALAAETDDFRRLIPHSRRDVINSGVEQWAARFETLGGLLNAAAQINEARQMVKRKMCLLNAYDKRVLKALAEKDGQMESALYGHNLKLSLRNQQRRSFALLEASGLVRREAIGRDKRIFLTEAGRELAESVKS